MANRTRPLTSHVAASQEIPALDSGRVTFTYEGPTGNPEDWSAATGNYGNYESYEPEHEAENYTAFYEGCAAVTMLIDGEPVHGREFSIYQDGEDPAPPDEEPPTEAELYAEYYAIKSGAVLKGETMKIHQSFTRNQLDQIDSWLRTAQQFQNYNGPKEDAQTTHALTYELNDARQFVNFAPTLSEISNVLFEFYLRLKHHSPLPDEAAEQLREIQKQVQALGYTEEDKKEAATVGVESDE